MSNVPRLRVFGVVLLAIALGGLTWQAWLLWSTESARKAAAKTESSQPVAPAEPVARVEPAARPAPHVEREPAAPELPVAAEGATEATEASQAIDSIEALDPGLALDARRASSSTGMPPEVTPAAEPGAPPVADPARLETLARLVGRVTLRGAATPVPGVQVRVTLDSTALVPAFTHDVTDAKGRFQFALSEPARVLAISVRPGPESCSLNRTLDGGLDLRLGTETVQDLAVMRGASLAGVVNGQDGLPIPGARVRAWNLAPFAVDLREQAEPDQEVVADATGAFRLGGLGTLCTLAADAPGLTGVARLEAQLASGRAVDGVSFELGPAREVRGLILQLADRPVAQCAVRARPVALAMRQPLPGVSGLYRVPPAAVKVTSDDQGKFVLRDLVSLPYEVTAESAQHQPWSGRHGPGDPSLKIRLEAGTTLTGEILATSGEPIADAQVTVCSLGGGAWPVPLRETSTDAQGHFEFLGLRPDPDGLLQVRAAGHALHVEQPVVIAINAPHHLQLVLAPARALAGVVVDEHDQPLVGRRLSIQGDRVLPLAASQTVGRVPTWESLFPEGNELTTDAQGGFRFDGLYDGLFELRVGEATGTGTAASLTVRSGDEQLRLVADSRRADGLTLSGTVRDATTGKPVEDFHVTTGDDQAFTGADGAFRLLGLKPGPLEVWVQAQGYCDLHVPLKNYAAGEYRLDLQLSVARSLSLRVVDASRRPLTDVRLSFAGEDARPLSVRSGAKAGAGEGAAEGAVAGAVAGALARATQLETDAAGEASVMGLPAAHVTVHAQKGLFGNGQDFRFDLSEELHGTQELVLGDESQATLLVLVLGAAEGGATSGSAASGLDAMIADLQQQVQAGGVWTIPTPLTIRALGADGRELAHQRLDPREPSAEATPLPGVAGAYSLKLTVPAEPLEIEASASGYESVRSAWQPDRTSDGDEVVLLVLRKL